MASAAGEVRTVGVEEELLLVDDSTGAPQALAAQLLSRTGYAEQPWGRLDSELQQEQVETDSVPCRELADLEADLRAGRAAVAGSAAELGAEVIASGTSPLPVSPHLTSKSRYRTMLERYGITAAEQLTCGCHVHVAVDSPDEGVAVADRVRDWLPVLLALSANSPFWQGQDTGYTSFRSQVWQRWPGAGPPDVIGDFAGYRRQVDALLRTGVVLDEGMLYADVRPSLRYPTVEVRVADVCLDVRDAVMLAGLTRALVDRAARDWRDGRPPAGSPTSLLRLASWQAAREGLTGQLLDPLEHRPRPAGEVVAALLEHVTEDLCRNGDQTRVEKRVDALLATGTGADRQRSAYRRTGRLQDVVTELVAGTCA